MNEKEERPPDERNPKADSSNNGFREEENDGPRERNAKKSSEVPLLFVTWSGVQLAGELSKLFGSAGEERRASSLDEDEAVDEEGDAANDRLDPEHPAEAQVEVEIAKS